MSTADFVVLRGIGYFPKQLRTIMATMASDYGEETYPLYRLKFSRYDDDNTDVDYEGSILLAIETDEGDDSDTSETYSDD